MTLLKSANGTLYDVPSDKLKQYEIAPEDVEEMMKASGVQPPQGIQPDAPVSQALMPWVAC
jgi:hypothetical protein